MNTSIKKVIKLVGSMLIVIALMLTAFGCNNGEKQEGVLPDDYTPEPSGKLKLTYHIASNESMKRAAMEYKAAFERAYPDVNVTPELSSTGDSNVISAMIAAGSIGDVFFAFESQVFNYAEIQKALMPLDYYVEAYDVDLSNVFNAMIDMGTVAGKMYMATCNYNHIIYYYNRDLITSAGLEDPVALYDRDEWSWDVFKDYCQKLTTTDDSAATQTVGANLRLNYSAEYIPFLEGFGGKWYDTVNKKVNFISDDKVVRGVQEIIDFVKSNTVKMTTVSIPKAAHALKATESQKNFADYNDLTQVCFRASEHDNMISIGRQYESANIDWDIINVPALPTHKVGTGCSGFVVSNATKNPDAAAAFALFIYTEAGQKAYHGQEGGAVPNIKTLAYDDDYWRVPFPDRKVDPVEGKNYDAFISYPEADTYAFVECVIPPEVAEIVKEYMQNVVVDDINGTRSMADTLSLLETEANQLWSVIMG